MIKSHKVNLYYSLFLIAIGIFGFLVRYFDQGDFQFTSLIPTIFGLVLIFMTRPIKNENAVIAHIAVAITALLAIVVTVTFIRNNIDEFILDRKNIIFLITGIVSYIVLGLHITGFLERRKSKD